MQHWFLLQHDLKGNIYTLLRSVQEVAPLLFLDFIRHIITPSQSLRLVNDKHWREILMLVN